MVFTPETAEERGANSRDKVGMLSSILDFRLSATFPAVSMPWSFEDKNLPCELFLLLFSSLLLETVLDKD